MITTGPTPDYPDPQKVLAAAIAFERIAATLLQVEVPLSVAMKGSMQFSPSHWEAMLPAFMVAAFCAELYLKCLLRVHKKRVPQTHDLLKLFDRLSADAQTDLEARYQRTSLKGPQTLRQALDNARDSFVTYRYFFEKDRSQDNRLIALPAIIVIARDAVWDLHPEWFPPPDQPTFQVR